MLKKSITYTDYNGTERTETHYFNLTKTEIMKMELSTKGGLTEMVQRIIAAQDTPALLEIFDGLIIKSYGIKDADGKGFVKDAAATKAFTESGAYDVLFMELVTDAKAAADFINGIVPADLAAEAAKQGNIPMIAPAN